MVLLKGLADVSGNLGMACMQHDLQLDWAPMAAAAASIAGALPNCSVPTERKDHQDSMAEVPAVAVKRRHERYLSQEAEGEVEGARSYGSVAAEPVFVGEAQGCTGL